MGGVGSGGHNKHPEAFSKHRASTMAALYREGYTLQQIADQYGISRERVRQVMTKRFGIRQADGGQRVRTQRSRERLHLALDGASLAKHGCTRAQYKELLAIGRRMHADGASRERTPTGAFIAQKRNARVRGIGWELTLWQWWTIWQESGHWHQRGRGQGYVMCRYGDVGPYAAGNVFIATGIENVSTSKVKKSGLPLGVSLKNGRYIAGRCIEGRKRYLGAFDTPELAHAAYLMAAPTQGAAA